MLRVGRTSPWASRNTTCLGSADGSAVCTSPQAWLLPLPWSPRPPACREADQGESRRSLPVLIGANEFLQPHLSFLAAGKRLRTMAALHFASCRGAAPLPRPQVPFLDWEKRQGERMFIKKRPVRSLCQGPSEAPRMSVTHLTFTTRQEQIEIHSTAERRLIMF